MTERLLASPDVVPGSRLAIRFPQRSIDYAGLHRAAGWVAERIAGSALVAVWADASLETCVAVVGALQAGVPIVLVNPKAGSRELAHMIEDSRPELLLTGPGATPSLLVDEPRRLIIELEAAEAGGGKGVAGVSRASGALAGVASAGVASAGVAEPSADLPALVVYTSGTTGPPKGAVLPRRAIAASLDALAEAWRWTDQDVVAHALPLFHVHGLVLGILGPLRRGGSARHLGRFSPEAVAGALSDDAGVLFGVPTMYRRLAEAAERDPAIARALAGARLLVSGSAALPAAEHERLGRLTGRQVLERYGMTETLMITAVRLDGDPRPGSVGPPLPGVDLRLVDDDGKTVGRADEATIGEVEVRGPNLFLGYLNRTEATASSFRDGWFRTGDLATRDRDGYVRLVGRRATDLIKSGGFKIGAGEIEGALREHPAVDDAAVTGESDSDLGERIVAWVVLREGERSSPDELAEHVASLLAPHKRPRIVRFVAELPRNELGKVQKQRLVPAD